MADTAKLPWDARAGIGLWLLLFAVVLADLFGNFTGAKGDTKLGILVLLVLLPSAASLKGFGVEFVRRTTDDAEAFKELHAKFEGRIGKLEKCCDESKPAAPRQSIQAKSLDARKPVEPRMDEERARARIIEMLSDRAYNMRSTTALENATGLHDAKLKAVLDKIPDVVPVARTDDGQMFYGFRERVRTYFEKRGQALPGK